MSVPTPYQRFKEITGCRMDYDTAAKEAIRIIVREAREDALEDAARLFWQEGHVCKFAVGYGASMCGCSKWAYDFIQTLKEKK